MLTSFYIIEKGVEAGFWFNDSFVVLGSILHNFI